MKGLTFRSTVSTISYSITIGISVLDSFSIEAPFAEYESAGLKDCEQMNRSIHTRVENRLGLKRMYEPRSTGT